ncbi:MAG: Ig-like domain-containing protein, partial [Christensenellales bacterium]
MKKLKTFVLIVVCLFSSAFLFACDKTIHVNSISLSETEIVLRPGESKDITVTVAPDNATNKNVEYVLTDDSCVSVVVDSNDKTKAKVVAKTNLTGTFTTFLQVVSEDGELRSDECLITIYTDKTQLFAPQNLHYDANTQLISWDNIDSASGYQLKINIEGEEDEEVFCVTNQYKIDEFLNKKISVQVKSKGDDVLYVDSAYSTKTFTFMQLEEPKNLTNVGSKVKFDKVENAERYEIYVYDGSLKSEPDYRYSILDSEFDETNGYEIYVLQNPGKKYFVKVKAFALSTQDVQVYESKSLNYIEVNKIATPLVNNSNLKFTYSTNTISWTSNPNASGYKLNRYVGGVLDKQYVFDAENAGTTFLIVDTESDKLVAGKYDYKLIVLGNGVNYLDSDESDALVVEKLSAPALKILNGEIVWNEVQNIGGYSFEIVGQKTENLTKNQTQYSLASKFGQEYPAGTYQFRIKSVGNGTNTISSEFSETYSFDKLANPETPTLVENRYVVIKVLNVVESAKVLITHLNSRGEADFVQEKIVNDFETSSN